jgi:hypothetical protein
LTIDEAARLRLYDSARQSWGEDSASTLMAGLAPPTVDWSELATKSDLKDLERRFDEKLDLKLNALESRLESRFLERMEAQTRTMVLSVVASNATFAGLIFAAVRLGG